MPPNSWAWELPEGTSDGAKEMPATAKGEEEIAKFTVDEHLSDIERTVLYLNGGQVIQQRHAIANLPWVLKGRSRSAFDTIAQPLKAALTKMDTEAQVAAAETFGTIAKERIMSAAELQACILPFVTRNLNKEKSEEETEAWLQTLYELIPVLDKEALKAEVLPLALSKGDVEGNVGSRSLCCKIIGTLATRLTWDEIDRTFFKKAMALSQDVDFQIRMAMAQQLGSICKAASKDALARSILPEMLELLRDEELKVRDAALSTLVSVLELLPKDVRKAQVLPILRNHMQPLELDPVLQRCVARVLGQLVTVVKGDFEAEDAQLFFGCFKHLASKSDPELRRLCAQQFPAVLRAAAALNVSAFSGQFQDAFNNLASDNDPEIRCIVASKFHEVASIVGRDAPALLTKPLVKLLRDEGPGVGAALLPHLSLTLQHWANMASVTGHADDPKRDAAVSEIAKALLDLEGRSNRAWRMHQALAQAFPTFPSVFTSEQINDHFLPIAWRYLSSTAAAVRPAAADSVAVFLRHNRRDKQRAELMLRLIRDVCRARSWQLRQTFADVANSMLRRFSSRFVKDYVFDLCLELLHDPVPNVRLGATALLPQLKHCVKLPEDVDLLERLNNAMSAVITDNDRDVSVAARAINEHFKKTPMRMAGAGAGGGAPGLPEALSSALSSDAEDKRREEDESDISFTQSDMQDILVEIRQPGSSLKKGPGAGASAAVSGAAALTKGAVSQRPIRSTSGDAAISARGSGGSSGASSSIGGIGSSAARGVLASGSLAAARRPGAPNSDDGTSGRSSSGAGSLGVVRPPVGGASSAAVGRLNTSTSGAASPTTSLTSPPATRAGAAVASAGLVRSGVGASPARGAATSTSSAGTASSAGASGVRLPAISSTRAPPAGPAASPAVAKAGLGAGRLAPAAASKASVPTSSVTAARKAGTGR